MRDFYTRCEFIDIPKDYINHIIYKTDKSFLGDEYDLSINYRNEIVIISNNNRGKKYALDSL